MGKKLLIATLLATIALSLTVGIAFAQDGIIGEGQSILYVVGAWLIYFIMGLLPSIISGDKFDAVKFGRSIIWALVVALLSIGMGLHPTVIEAEYTNLVSEVVNFIGNSGFGLSLIYFFDKLYRTVTGLAAKYKIEVPA